MGSDTREEFLPTASRKVPATDSSGKEDIASKEDSLGRQIEGDASGAVAGNVEQGEIMALDRPLKGSMHWNIERGEFFRDFVNFRDTKPSKIGGIKNHGKIDGMSVNRTLKGLLDQISVPYVIKVSMGQQHPRNTEFGTLLQKDQ